MKVSNEVKIGIVTVVTIVAAICVFGFLKGKNIFKNTAEYYVVYDNVGGLAISSPVEVNGFQVGVVQSIRFLDATSGKLLVVLSVDNNFQLPINTVAEVKPVSIIAGMKVQLKYGEGPGFYSSKDTLQGTLNASIITTLEEDIDPILDNFTSVVARLDSVVGAVSTLLSPTFIKDVNHIGSNLEATTASLNNLIADKENEIDGIIENLGSFVNMLAENTEELNSTFTNLASISDSIAVSDLTTTINNLKTTLEGTITLLGNLNSGEGSAGQLLTDETLYNSLNETVTSLNLLLEDLNNNPRRYVHFSLFGKKDSKEK